VSERATLALADGRVFYGKSFGAPGKRDGEVVFNTSMAGYQEIITDPSYAGQIVVMTCTEIGNVGVNPEDDESFGVRLSGFAVREYWSTPSNWRSVQSLGDWMLEREIVGIHDIDTRALVRHIRDHGAQQGVIASGEVDERALVEEAAALPPMEGQDLASVVTCAQPYSWRRGTWSLADGHANPSLEGPLVAVLDFGVKLNILRNLCDLGCRVAVLPSGSDAESVRALNPDGLFLSNGPGDPDAVEGAVELVRQLLPDYPTFGICLGHQVLALALGAKTYKMKFGHHGGNQPVQEIDTGVIDITSQNHGFAVDADSLPDTARVTHINLNDGTVEGLAHRGLPVFSVQYHPESSPGPHEARHLFDRFIDSMAIGTSAAATEGLLQRDLVAGRG